MAVLKYSLEKMLGQVFNRLTITGEIPCSVKIERKLTYTCVCGNTGAAKPSHIVKGVTKSCGCLHKETSSKNGSDTCHLLAKYKANVKHNMYGTRPYHIWSGMCTRCLNSKTKEYKDYGGRGITVSESWKDFASFWEDMQDGYQDNLTLERIDNNKGYYKGITCWATMKEQSHNRRKSSKITSSEYLGVSKRDTNTWRVRIVNPSGVRLEKTFKEELLAAEWYDNCAEEFYGKRPNNT